ncbi:response regulator [Streptacidiphilus sp. PAMC 29251]
MMAALAAPRPYDILLVEDDLADAMLIEEALLQRGAARSINQVDDGVAALERLRDPAIALPDLIVLDLNMPRMNGRELLNVLKNDEALKVIRSWCCPPPTPPTTSPAPTATTATPTSPSR